MTRSIGTVIYPAKDLARAKAVFSTLIGAEPDFDDSYYVGFNVGDQHIGLDPHGHRDGPVGYWRVEDIHQTLEALLAAGATAHSDVHNVGGGKLVASVTDAEGNVIGLEQPA